MRVINLNRLRRFPLNNDDFNLSLNDDLGTYKDDDDGRLLIALKTASTVGPSEMLLLGDTAIISAGLIVAGIIGLLVTWFARKMYRNNMIERERFTVHSARAPSNGTSRPLPNCMNPYQHEDENSSQYFSKDNYLQKASTIAGTEIDKTGQEYPSPHLRSSHNDKIKYNNTPNKEENVFVNHTCQYIKPKEMKKYDTVEIFKNIHAKEKNKYTSVNLESWEEDIKRPLHIKHNLKNAEKSTIEENNPSLLFSNVFPEGDILPDPIDSHLNEVVDVHNMMSIPSSKGVNDIYSYSTDSTEKELRSSYFTSDAPEIANSQDVITTLPFNVKHEEYYKDTSKDYNISSYSKDLQCKLINQQQIPLDNSAAINSDPNL